ncbi:MAG: hypothetical protein PHQ27_07050 [Victivallales bacterium]|nr:hypothetical protein [Victivallales bacterium]
MEINNEHMQQRTVRLVLILAAWAVVIVIFLLNYSVFQRDRYRRQSRKLAWRTGTYTALRGRIIAADGTVLAWSEKRYALMLTRMIAADKAADLVQELSRLRPGSYPDLTAVQIPRVLCPRLSPDEIGRAAPLLKRFPALQLLAREERAYRISAADCARVGEVIWRGGRMVGISGLEQQYDRVLTGRDGVYRVMVNRHGQWVPGSWQAVNAPENGRDVRLPPPDRVHGGQHE